MTNRTVHAPAETARREAVLAAIAAAGGPVKLADELSRSGTPIKSQAISQWKQVPAERALEVERVTGVSRYVLRPDVYGPPPLRSATGGEEGAAA